MKSLLKAGIRRLAATQRPERALGRRQARVIAVCAEKGGVGKTTTAVNLAAALAREHGKRVLIVDLDPQAHVTTALASELLVGGGALSDVLTDESGHTEVMDVVAPTRLPNLYVTPPDPSLARTEDLIGTRIGKEFILREALTATRTHYDVILLDCPPHRGNLSINALVAADLVLVPCDPSPLSLKGVEALVSTVGTVAGRLNPQLDVLGVLLTRVDGRNKTLNDTVEQSIKESFGEDGLVPVHIGISASLSKAQLEGQDIFQYEPESRGAQQYGELARWVAQRIF